MTTLQDWLEADSTKHRGATVALRDALLRQVSELTARLEHQRPDAQALRERILECKVRVDELARRAAALRALAAENASARTRNRREREAAMLADCRERLRAREQIEARELLARAAALLGVDAESRSPAELERIAAGHAVVRKSRRQLVARLKRAASELGVLEKLRAGNRELASRLVALEARLARARERLGGEHAVDHEPLDALSRSAASENRTNQRRIEQFLEPLAEQAETERAWSLSPDVLEGMWSDGASR